MKSTWHCVEMLKAQLDGMPRVYTLPVSRNVTVSQACRIVRSEFAVKGRVVASVYGSSLDLDSRLFGLVRSEDVVLFSAADGGRLDFDVPLVPPVNDPEGVFRLFTSCSVQSMTEGDRIDIGSNMSLSECQTKVGNLIRSKFPAVPAGSQYHIFLPGGAIMEDNGKTIGDFMSAFPKARRRLYAVVTRPITKGDLEKEIKEVCCVKEEMRALLGCWPDGPVSDLNLCAAACLLGYFQRVGPSADMFIHSISKIVPFAPLINGLRVLYSHQPVYGITIPQIIAPLYTLFKEIGAIRSEAKEVFDGCLEILPFFGQFEVRYVPSQTTFFKAP
jgi:hypothetical protein